MKLYESESIRFIKVQKREKRAVETNWTTYNNYIWSDEGLQKWIQEGGNVGVATGFANLVVVDFDDKDFQKKMFKRFPETLTQESGSGGLHLFFICDVEPESFKILNDNKETLCDVQGKGRQIIVHPSIHPNGNQYKFINNKPIASISYSEIKAIFRDYLSKDSRQPTVGEVVKDVFPSIINKPSLTDTLRQYGVNVHKNPTDCPLHSSKGGKCFSFNEKKGCFNCFHCGWSGDVISFVMRMDNVSFKSACMKLGINEAIAEKVQQQKKQKVLIDDIMRADPNVLAGELVATLSKHENIFYRPYFNELVELQTIRSQEDEDKKRLRVVLNKIDEDRFINILSSYFYFYEMKLVKDEWVEKQIRLPKSQISVLMKNDILLKSFRILDRVMNRPYLYSTSDGLKTEWEGYSYKTNQYYTTDTPAIQEVTTQQAKEELEKILTGFCFEDESDKVMARAFIITPALRGLYLDKRERTPCFALLANRERAGKDYLANVRNIIYTGSAVDHPPIADGERSNVEEWRKKFSSMMISGQTIFHSANNVGFLNNPVFEALITSKVIEDRLLGSNTQKILDNYLDLSFSANIGLRWRGDMSGRLRRITLFYSEEDPNSRRFPIPDLHGYIELNRGYILSCIYQLIRDWYESGMPCQENKIFSSFPVWAKYCGAIMDYHNLGDPLQFQEDDEVGGNEDDRIMGAVYEYMYIWQQNNDKSEIKSSDVIEALSYYQDLNPDAKKTYGFVDVNDDILMSINLQTKGDKLKIGHLITRFKGRVMKGIKFKMIKQNKEAKRRIYTFERVNHGRN